MKNADFKKFFEDYIQWGEEHDAKKVAGAYADNFIFADPNGIMPMENNAELVKKYGDIEKHYKKVGRTSTHLVDIDTTELDDLHYLVKVKFGMTFKKTGDEMITFDISYIIRVVEGEPKIMLYISHEDEMEVLKKNELISA